MKRLITEANRGHLGLSRRTFVAQAAAGLGAALVGCKSSKPSGGSAPGASGVYGEAKIDWQQAKGQELTLAFSDHPWSAALIPLIPKFMELTSVRVTANVVSETELLVTMPLSLSGGAPTPDLFMMAYMGTMITQKSLEPLDGYYADGNLTDRGWYDEADIFGSARDFVVGPDNKTRYGVPLTAECSLLMARQDLLDEKGLAMPKTFDELLKVATALKSPSVAGIALRGKQTVDASWPELCFISSYGGEIVDEQGAVVFDSPEAVAGAEMYIKLLKEAGPPQGATYSWYEVLNSMMQGTAAIACDASNFAPDIDNASKSKVSGKVAYGLPPLLADKPLKRGIFHWMLGMNAHSKSKTAAWLFLEWATSKPTCLELGRSRAAPARSSTWKDPGFQGIFGEKAAKVTLDYLTAADGHTMRRTFAAPHASDICAGLAHAMNQALLGVSDVKTALAVAARKLNAKRG